MTFSSRIIILHTLKFRDNSVIINGYSDSAGRQNYILYFSGKSKKYAALSSLHPLSIIDAQIGSTKGDLKTITEFHPAYKLQSIRCNIIKCSLAMFMSELLFKTVKELEKNPELFSFIEASIIELEKIDTSYKDYHLRFVARLCGYMGYLPEDNFSSSNRIFSLTKGRFSNGLNPGESYFNEVNSAALHSLLCEDFNTSNILTSGKERSYFLEELIRYLSYHSGFEINIQSLSILHEVFE